MTLATFFSEGRLDTAAAFLMAGLIGIAFGFWLERAGFGSSRKLTSIFYLRDFAVFQVMFTAIVTALVGLRILIAIGRVDPSSVYQMETFLTPQIVAGLDLRRRFRDGRVVPGYGAGRPGFREGRCPGLPREAPVSAAWPTPGWAPPCRTSRPPVRAASARCPRPSDCPRA